MLPVILLAAGALVLVSASGKKSSNDEDPSLEGIAINLAGVEIAVKEKPAGRESASTRGGPKRKKAKRLLPKMEPVNFGNKIRHMSGASSRSRPNRGACNRPMLTNELQINQLKAVAAQVPLPRKLTSTKEVSSEANKAIKATISSLKKI